MNKFSPMGTGRPEDDFDFGDLVTMTVIDVFETDADNRAVHKTPEMVERVRKGYAKGRMLAEAAARSPAGKGAAIAGRAGYRAALVVGNAAWNRVRNQRKSGGEGVMGAEDVPEEDQLNELLESQIATDETDVDASRLDASALNVSGLGGEEPNSSPKRYAARNA